MFATLAQLPEGVYCCALSSYWLRLCQTSSSCACLLSIFKAQQIQSHQWVYYQSFSAFALFLQQSLFSTLPQSHSVSRVYIHLHSIRSILCSFLLFFSLRERWRQFKAKSDFNYLFSTHTVHTYKSGHSAFNLGNQFILIRFSLIDQKVKAIGDGTFYM